MNSRWKNYGLWVSILSLVGVIVKSVYPIPDVDFNNISTLILSILVAAGVISNPTNGKGYIDK